MANEKQLQTKEKKYNLKNDIIFQTFFSRKGNEEYLSNIKRNRKRNRL